MTPGGRLESVLVTVGIAGAYYASGRLGLQLAFVHASATAVWPPAGISLAAFLLLGRRAWPGVFAGAFLVNLSTPGSVATSLGIAVGNTLEGLLGGWLVNRFAGGSAALRRPPGVLLFTFLAGLLSPVVAATLGVTSLAVAGYADWGSYGTIWATWWLGDACGALLVGSLLATWAEDPSIRADKGTLEAAAMLAGICLTAQAVFGEWIPGIPARAPVAFLCVPGLVWAAFRLDPKVNAAALAVLGGVATWRTLEGSGPFASVGPGRSLALLQCFLGIHWFVSMLLGAAVAERRRTELDLRRAGEELERRVADRTAELTDASRRLLEAQRIARLGNWDWEVGPDRLRGSAEFWRILGRAGDPGPGPAARFVDAVHPEDRAGLDRLLGEAGLGVADGEFRIVLPDGGIRVVHLAGRPVGPGAPPRVVGTLQDVTERRREEEERARLAVQLQHGQKLQAVGQMAAGIAHEINNPNAYILSNLGSLEAALGELERIGGNGTGGREEALRAQAYLREQVADWREALQESRRGSERIRDIVRSLNSFSHPGEAEAAPVDLNGLLDGAIQLCVSELRFKAEVYRDPGELPPVHCHPQQVQQVFVNLLVNAAQSIGRFGEIHVSTRREGDRAVVRIRDTGCGIPPENLKRVFEPFFTTKPVGKGTGLGLHVSYKILQAHRGRIEVSSTPGAGTEFSVHLPIGPGA